MRATQALPEMLGRNTLQLSLPAFQCLANTSRWTKPQELSQSGGLESTACRLQCDVEQSKGVGKGGPGDKQAQDRS